MLKSIFSRLLTGFILLLVFAAFAQEKKTEASTATPKIKAEDHYLALTTFYQNALEHVKVLYNQASNSPKLDEAIANEHLDEVCRSLNAAKKHQAAVEQELSAYDKIDFQDHLDAINKYRAKAKEHYQELDNELFKNKTDPQEVQNIAASLYRDLMKAFDEYKAMRQHAGVPAPIEPPLVIAPIQSK